MKLQSASLKKSAIRTRIILTGVIPALVPWLAIIMPSQMPDVLTRYFLFSKGWIAWTLIEYSMHRWAFHKKIHIKGRDKDIFNHHHHHAQPENMILTRIHRAVGILVILAGITTLFKGNSILAYVAGISSGISFYILMHWFLHQKMAAAIFPNLVRQHIWHHCKYPNLCFGITSTMWDRMFKTMPEEFKMIPDNMLKFYYKHEHPVEDDMKLIADSINRLKPVQRGYA